MLLLRIILNSLYSYFLLHLFSSEMHKMCSPVVTSGLWIFVQNEKYLLQDTGTKFLSSSNYFIKLEPLSALKSD